MKLLLATGNAGKLREIRGLLAPAGLTVCGLADLEAVPQVVEDRDTFLGNARKKAWTLARDLGVAVLADDSGLVVDALGGAPGVHSARYAGAGASDADNNHKLLAELVAVPDAQRTAAFVCAMVFALPGADEREYCAEGRLQGRILQQPSGHGGFGYDPLFFEPTHQCTLAEMDLATKNSLSHRARALEQLVPTILDWARAAARESPAS